MTVGAVLGFLVFLALAGGAVWLVVRQMKKDGDFPPEL